LAEAHDGCEVLVDVGAEELVEERGIDVAVGVALGGAWIRA